MPLPRFHAPELKPGHTDLPETEARHALQVLRLRPSDEVIVFDGAGRHARGFLETDDETPRSRKKERAARVRVAEIQSTPPPTHTLTLITAACKGPRLDWLIEKCTELGVTRVTLANFERSVVRPSRTHLAKLRRTALEACKQCGRNWLPKIDAGLTLADALRLEPQAPLLVAHPTHTATLWAHWLTQPRDDARSVRVVVGPEGGLTPVEFDRLREADGTPILLGDHILRVETAAISAAATWAASTAQAPKRMN
jgi:16S rRNA (uracil1498-N3)-methyltransferase